MLFPAARQVFDQDLVRSTRGDLEGSGLDGERRLDDPHVSKPVERHFFRVDGLDVLQHALAADDFDPLGLNRHLRQDEVLRQPAGPVDLNGQLLPHRDIQVHDDVLRRHILEHDSGEG